MARYTAYTVVSPAMVLRKTRRNTGAEAGRVRGSGEAGTRLGQHDGSWTLELQE